LTSIYGVKVRMSFPDQPIPLHCTRCGEQAQPGANFCTKCGAGLGFAQGQDIHALAYLINQLTEMLRHGELSEEEYRAIHQRYREVLDKLLLLEPVAVPAPQVRPSQPARPAAPPPQPLTAEAVPVAERFSIASWCVAQAPSLLLFVGAFLTIMAALVFVASAGVAASGGGRFFLVLVFTAGFVLAGWFCHRYPRVALAGRVFLAIGAFLTPLVFAAAYNFLLQQRGFAVDVLWFTGSAYSAVFYGVIVVLGMGRLYAYLAVAALLSTWGAAIAVLNVPVEWVPALYILLGGGLTVLFWHQRRWVPAVFTSPAWFFAHLVAAAAILFTLVGMLPMSIGGSQPQLWFLPVTLALGSAFYGIQRPSHILNQVASLVLAGGTVLGVVAALRLEGECYGAALAGLGLVYTAGWFAPWTKARMWHGLLWPLALVATTLAWLLILPVYVDLSWFGAFVFLAAALVYALGSAFHVSWFEEMAALGDLRERRWDPQVVTIIGRGLLYAWGAAFSGGYYFLLRGILGVEAVAEAGDIALIFFPLSLGLVLVAATARWWYSAWVPHLYLVAVGLSLLVISSGAAEAGPFLSYMVGYFLAAAAVVAWERKLLWGAAVFPYGLLAMVAFARFVELPDEYWPYLPAGTGVLFYVGSWLRMSDDLWRRVGRYGSHALVGAAPVVGLVLLAVRSDQYALTGVEAVETRLYLASTAAVGLLAVALFEEFWRYRRVTLAVTAGALGLVSLLMGIGHFHPDNIQAYTVPGGLYTLVVAILLGRVRRGLPESLYDLPGWLELSAALAILGPGLLQSFEDVGFAGVVLGEALVILLIGVAMQRRFLVLPAVAFIGALALQLTLGVALALPSWVVLGIAGAFLLSLGLLLLMGRNTWSRWQQTVAAWWMRWEN
jgi:hypothetical protein